MECWTFPRKYDPDYFPDPSSRFWFRERETMPAADRDRAILTRLQEVARYAWNNSAFYRRKWDEAGRTLPLHAEATHKLQAVLGLRAQVEIVPPGTFPRTDLKARRVIDRREVLSAMQAKLASRG